MDQSDVKFSKSLLTVALGVAQILCCVSLVDAQVLSEKRGFADVGASYNYLQATNAGWYYGWRPDKPAGAANFDAKFRPMIWGAHQANQTEINNILSYGDIDWVLGFNEPERPDQANLTVSQAISAWQVLDAGFDGTGIKLVSPGVADTGGADGGQAWLADFMNQANSQNLQVDAVAFHWYGVSNPNDPIGAGNSFLSRVDSYHNSYGLPVFITEFAIHDWGGAYSDEEMREANAIFLDYVVPRLESRAHVAGYSWYNWFSDSPLVEGGPLTPTNVGLPYVGTIDGGEFHEIGGTDLGEHVAYLTGGELRRNNAAAGAVRYINALSGASDISGTNNWGLNNASNWVRVQPGATLRKAGSNQITFDNAGITNHGVIEVAAGTLQIGTTTTVAGSNLAGSGHLLVRSGGTLDLVENSVITSAILDMDVEMRGGTVTTNETGGVVVRRGAALFGEGTVASSLTVQQGSTLRVGDVGISRAARVLIDDFQSYPVGQIGATPNTTGNVWTGVSDGTQNVEIVTSRNRALQVSGTGGSWRGAVTNLQDNFATDVSLEHGETGTYFFRVRRTGTASIDTIFGLTDQQATTNSPPGDDINDPWNEYAVLLSIVGNSTNSMLRAYSEGSGDVNVIPVATNEWTNVWLTVDNDAKTYRVATSSGSSDGTDSGGVFQFGRRIGSIVGASALQTFGLHELLNVDVELDDLFYLDGVDLTNPTGGFDPGLLVEAATFYVQGDFRLLNTASLELDIYDPAAVDLLSVTGNLQLDGLLQVTLDPNAPAPSMGNTFDILDFSSSSGQFDELSLPVLASGLAWNVSQLPITGELQIVADVDLDNDGDVDGNDFLLIQNSDPSLLAQWAANYGSELVTPIAALAAVPEPTSLASLALGACLLFASGRNGTWRKSTM